MNKKAIIINVVLLALIFSAFVFIKTPPKQNLVDKECPLTEKSSNISSDWNTLSSHLRYTIDYPKKYVIESSGYYSYLLYKLSDEPGAGPANLVYVSVVQPNQVNNEGDIYGYNPTQFKKLQYLKVGESVSLADPDQPVFDQYMTYTRVDDAEIDGYTAKRFENNSPWEKPTGTTEVRYYFEDNKYNFDEGGFIYVLGYYYGGEGVTDPIDAREAFNIVSSFHVK